MIVTGYKFTDLTVPLAVGAKQFLLHAYESGFIPFLPDINHLPPGHKDRIYSDVSAILNVTAPIIAQDVLLEIRSAMQRVVWGPGAEPLTDEQTILWDGLTGVLGEVQQRLTEGT